MVYSYQNEKRKVIFLIDSKSFYASVESVYRGLNPLKSMLVVISEEKNINGGLVLASSPMAKKYLGISNINRQRDVPNIKGLVKAQPRMNLYIKENLRVNRIFSKYTEERSILPYSIDESILDLTYTWHLFGKTSA